MSSVTFDLLTTIDYFLFHVLQHLLQLNTLAKNGMFNCCICTNFQPEEIGISFFTLDYQL